MEIQMNGNTLRGDVNELVQFVKEYEQKTTVVPMTKTSPENLGYKGRTSRMRKPNYTKAEINEMKYLYKQGATDEEIAKTLGRTTAGVQRKRAKLGYTLYKKRQKRRNQNQRWTEAEDRKLLKLVSENSTWNFIAKELGRTKHAIRARHNTLQKNTTPTKLTENLDKKRKEKKTSRKDVGWKHWTKTEDKFIVKEMRLGRKPKQIAQVLTGRTLPAIKIRMHKLKTGKILIDEPNNDSKAVVGAKVEAYGSEKASAQLPAESVSNDNFNY